MLKEIVISENPNEVSIIMVGIQGPTGAQGEQGPPGSSGTTNHSNLSNLDADDHPQYLSKKLANALYVEQSEFNSHINNTSNPHNVTKSQIGLGNVDNTSDANKPVSIAQQAALNTKANSSHTHDSAEITNFLLSILGAQLKGLGAGVNTPIAETDTIIEAFANLQNQISNASGGAAIGSEVESGVEGSILFIGALGVLDQDNSTFFYNKTATSLKFKKWQLSQDNMEILGADGVVVATIQWNPQGSNPGFGFTSNAYANVLCPPGYYVLTNNQFISCNHPFITGLGIYGHFAQAVDLQRIRTASGNEAWVIDKNGQPAVKVNSAPDDADIDANQCFWWFDSTKGAAKVMFKGKSEDGTVVTAKLAAT